MLVMTEETLDRKRTFDNFKIQIKKWFGKKIKRNDNIHTHFSNYYFRMKDKKNDDNFYITYNTYSKVIYFFNEKLKDKLLQGKTINYPVFGKIVLEKYLLPDRLYNKLLKIHKSFEISKWYLKPKTTSTLTSNDYKFKLSVKAKNEITENKKKDINFVFKFNTAKKFDGANRYINMKENTKYIERQLTQEQIDNFFNSIT